jgi:hypothetical protein
MIARCFRRAVYRFRLRFSKKAPRFPTSVSFGDEVFSITENGDFKTGNKAVKCRNAKPVGLFRTKDYVIVILRQAWSYHIAVVDDFSQLWNKHQIDPAYQPLAFSDRVVFVDHCGDTVIADGFLQEKHRVDSDSAYKKVFAYQELFQNSKVGILKDTFYRTRKGAIDVSSGPEGWKFAAEKDRHFVCKGRIWVILDRKLFLVFHPGELRLCLLQKCPIAEALIDIIIGLSGQAVDLGELDSRLEEDPIVHVRDDIVYAMVWKLPTDTVLYDKEICVKSYQKIGER